MKKSIKFLGTLIFPSVCAVILSFLFTRFVLSAASVDGTSMDNTLHDSDILGIEKLIANSNNLKNGQIIAFNAHNDDNDIFVKRIIGIEGDKIMISDGYLYLNGVKQNEEYVTPGVTYPGKFIENDTEIIVPKGKVFVLGDNRQVSMDSRNFGFVDIDDVIGRIVIRFYPFDDVKIFK